jgi:DNA-binding response OmpR family regulator
VPKKPVCAILVVEDEWLIAEFLQEVLQTAGYEVCGPAARVDQAIKVVESVRLNAAVLDVSLRGEKSFAIAHALANRSIPFVFMTGYVNNDFPVEFKNRPMLNKPIDSAKLVDCIHGLLGES